MKFLSRWSPVALSAALTISWYNADGIGWRYIVGVIGTALLAIVMIIVEARDPSP